MNKDDKQKWIDDVFDSMQGSRRAKPSPELFGKIETEIDAPEARVIPMYQWRLTAAAAVLLLVLNVFALRQVAESNALNTGEWVVERTSNQQLISNFKIYE